MTPQLFEIDPGDTEGLARVRALLDAAERADGFPAFSDQAVLAARQGRRRVFGLPGPDGSLDGAGILGEGELDLVVRPEARGRGIGVRLLEGLVRAQDHTPGELRAWAHGTNSAAVVMLTSAGFEPIRSLYRLALDPQDLDTAIAQLPPLPRGIVARPFQTDLDADIDDWVRVNAAAFAEHPEQGAVTRADFVELSNEPWFDADDLILAFAEAGARTADAGRGSSARAPLAGYSWIKTLRSPERVETELYVLGVDPAYAGRGLGAALLGETLRRMREHRPDRITLYVDGDNAPARRLYDRAGFTVDQRSTQWMRAAATDTMEP